MKKARWRLRRIKRIHTRIVKIHQQCSNLYPVRIINRTVRVDARKSIMAALMIIRPLGRSRTMHINIDCGARIGIRIWHDTITARRGTEVVQFLCMGLSVHHRAAIISIPKIKQKTKQSHKTVVIVSLLISSSTRTRS